MKSTQVHTKPNKCIYLTKSALVLMVHFSVIISIVLFGLYYLLFNPKAETFTYPACVLLSLLFIWLFWSWYTVTHHFFDPYTMFLLAAMMFNGGQALLEVFRLNNDTILGARFTSEILLTTLYLITLGMACFHLGALFGVTAFKRTRKKDVAQNKESVVRVARLVGWILLLISIIPAVLQLAEAAKVVLSSGYFALFQRKVATGFGAILRVLSAFLVPAALFLLAGSQKRKGGIILSGCIIVSYSALQFFLGSRASATMPLLAYAWLWHRLIRPLPKALLVAATLLLFFVVFPLVASVRTTAGAERLEGRVLWKSFLSINNPLIESISEMGGSMMTVAYTVKLVPSVRQFDLGVGYFYALLTLIPNLFWDVHPTVSHGLAADWLVKTIAPSYAAVGGGYGFSFIAEAYLNFGWIGVTVALFLIGFLLGAFVQWAQKTSEPDRLATIASFMAFFLLYARGESGSIIRGLVWYSFLPYLLVAIVLRMRRPSRETCRHH